MLNKNIFNVEAKNHELLKLAYDSYLANRRKASATTLQRGEVRGGGRKPWRQKGTGRARFGSIRNPIWRGGGVVFGPRGNENYTKRLSKTMKIVAVKQALTLANKAKKIIETEKFAPINGKTKSAVEILTKSGAKLDKRVLLVVAEKTDDILRSTKNIPSLKVIRPTYLNVHDILNADSIVFVKGTLPMVEKWLLGENKK